MLVAFGILLVHKGDDDFLLLVCSDARRSSLFAGCQILMVNYLQIQIVG